MPSYEAPVAEVLFLLHDVFVMQRYNHLPGFADASPDTVAAILEEGGKFCSEVLTPLNRQGDIQGCTRHPDGSVSTPNGFKEAYAQLVSGGWVGLSCPPEFGGQGLPSTLTLIVNEFLVSANHSFYMYSALVQGAVMTIQTHGSDALKQKYLPKLVEGAWASTMNLTEPHCGTDLGLLRTKAVPQPDGTYKISGTKIFISGGEHDLTENIIHLVIARIEGAPAGTKGISLFIVPKIMVNDDGTLGQKNGVTCGSVEHKMGIKGSATCVMNYDNAVGYLVGQKNRGLAAMFVMMNDARIAVGVQSLALSEVAYQNAATFTKERLQGRALTGPKFPDKPADPILVHPDVRRTLLTIRAINEAGRAFAIWLSLFGDVAFRSREEKEREHADDMMGLLTPVLKGALTDWGFRNTVNAQQLYGGHGYIAEAAMEQFVRDARIPMIYEGANGIQALDLVRRKLPRDNGRAVTAFFDEVQSFLNAYKADEAMKPFVRPLEVSFGHLQQATTWFADNTTENPDNAGAGSTDYLHLFGLVVFGLMWCRIVWAVNEKLANGTGTNGGLEQSALKDKLIVARFFFERLLPETSLRLNRIEMGSANVMEMTMEGF